LFVMCTNIFNCNVAKVMELYKMRWRVELWFKR
jgi:IS4 transposase